MEVFLCLLPVHDKRPVYKHEHVAAARGRRCPVLSTWGTTLFSVSVSQHLLHALMRAAQGTPALSSGNRLPAKQNLRLSSLGARGVRRNMLIFA